ncbi:hypothetical protein M0811_13348 [Anaeramoeba ignava]|uniref:Uncharacterized protein n=1 Tax=Anaeramoeba ignava TaxID=1746090 RepID=A0A9Q0L6C6_ANAIG|nr:hypothetical protein M0811_13348 [Anaeramoeba ignava]
MNKIYIINFNWSNYQFVLTILLETLIDRYIHFKENKNFIAFSSSFTNHQQIQKLSNKIIENSSVLFGNEEELKQFSISLFLDYPN